MSQYEEDGHAERLRQTYLKQLHQELKLAAYYLKIYFHAHKTGNSVPPHLNEEARVLIEKLP